MSYYTMDHGDWVQRQIPYAKESLRGRRPKRDQHGGLIGWGAAPDHLTRFQLLAFDILGIVGGGIYNAPICWDTVWWHPDALSITWRHGGQLSTYDGNGLTELVLLAHVARVRVDVSPGGPGMLKITLSQRRLAPCGYAHHPDLAEAVGAVEALLPADHRLRNLEELPG